MDEDVELHRLRERVYGAGGAPATPEVIARLAELEDRARRAVAIDDRPPETGVADAASPEHHPADDVPDDVARAGSSAAEAAPPRRLRRAVLTVAGAVVVLGVGIAIGVSATATTPEADPAAAAYPELTFPQTIEDVISADVLRDSAIDASSTRYIATVSDFRIYFAQPDDGDGRCIVTFISSDNRPWSAGCASGAQEGAALFGVSDTLSIAIGTPDRSQVTGIPIRLSDSVTAYVAR